MADDIEDFLRRAAQRRQRARNQRPRPPEPRRARPPEYSDRHAERRAPRDVELVEPEEVLTAEVIEAAAPAESTGGTSDDAHERLAEHIHEVFDHSGLGALKVRDKAEAIKAVRRLDPLSSILELFHRPGGMAEAVIIREVLDRPTDRW